MTHEPMTFIIRIRVLIDRSREFPHDVYLPVDLRQIESMQLGEQRILIMVIE